MAMIDTYRNNISRKQTELARFQSQRAAEVKKSADCSKKINSASQAISRTTNASTARTKMREIERQQNTQAGIEKKIADIDGKIAKKQKEIYQEQEKLRKEEESQERKRRQEQINRDREQANKLAGMDNTLSRHSALHKETQKMIQDLQKLPTRIKVLFLAANPLDQIQLRLDEEVREIGEMIRKSEHRDSVELVSRWAVRPIDVLQSLNEIEPTIVHFSGHGTDTDQIVFQGSEGESKFVSKEAIVQTMQASSNSIRLVFFNTCYSRDQAESLTQYVESSIGMKTSIGDTAARLFSSQFYSAIGFGRNVKKAFEQAKALLMLENIGEEETPELFVREGIDPESIVIVRPPKNS